MFDLRPEELLMDLHWEAVDLLQFVLLEVALSELHHEHYLAALHHPCL